MWLSNTTFFDKLKVTRNFFMSYCTIISSVILGRFHENLFTFFFLPGVKKKNELLWIFFNEITKPFTNCNSKFASNKFHKNNLKTEKNFHPKFSWERPKLTYEIIVQNGHFLFPHKLCLTEKRTYKLPIFFVVNNP